MFGLRNGHLGHDASPPIGGVPRRICPEKGKQPLSIHAHSAQMKWSASQSPDPEQNVGRVRGHSPQPRLKIYNECRLQLIGPHKLRGNNRHSDTPAKRRMGTTTTVNNIAGDHHDIKHTVGGFGGPCFFPYCPT